MTDPIHDAEEAILDFAIRHQLAEAGDALVNIAAESRAGRYLQAQAAMDRWYECRADLDVEIVLAMLAKSLWPWAVEQAQSDRTRFEQDLARMLGSDDGDPARCPDMSVEPAAGKGILSRHRCFLDADRCAAPEGHSEHAHDGGG
jgi:hypothetical protein